MSFELLTRNVIEADLCIGCGMCARGCKHITMQEPQEGKKKGIPELTGICILTRNGLDCGNCYNDCPVVRKAKRKEDILFLNPRERVMKAVKSVKNGITIPKIASSAEISSLTARYEVLRLVELKKVRLEVSQQKQEPFFFEIIE